MKIIVNITDEQIRELEAAFRREGNRTMARFCNRAVIGSLMPNSRARCIEIWNSRKGS